LTVPHARCEAEFEALLRLASARDLLDRALLGDPVWLCPASLDALADLLRSCSRFLRMSALAGPA